MRPLIGIAIGTALAVLVSCASTPPKSPVDYTGPQGRDAIKSVVAENIDQVQQCYAHRLVREENFQCRLTYAIEIDSTGHASEVKLKTANGCKASSPIVSCIKKAIGSWRFHPPVDGEAIEVNYPFVLRKQPTDHMPASVPAKSDAPAAAQDEAPTLE